MIWFTSDTHFGHKNILGYCNRPFKTIEEMNQTLVDNWNLIVKKDDTVYHLGDFSFLPRQPTKDIIEALNGTKYLVRGNHDRGPNFYGDGINFCTNLEDKWQQIIYVDDYKIEASHFPEKLKCDKDFHFCGHIHTQWRSWEKSDGTIIYNVGVDEWDYRPISIKDILEDMKNPKHRVVGDWKDEYHE